MFCCPKLVFEKSGVVCAPEFLSRTSILSIRPRTFACICCPQFPYYPCNNETHSAGFSNRRGAFLYFCFCFCLFCEHCSEKGECRCKGGNPRRICVTARLPVQLALCLAESALPESSVVCGSDATTQSSKKGKNCQKEPC